ncbi:MAG: xylan 1,4-beta-xylosidase, partial [Actinomycetota bacterium]
MLLAASCGSAGGILEREAAVTVDGSKTSISRLTNGITHTRQSADGWNDRESVGRARGLIRSSGLVQNQYIMGFGAGNPEPAPGRFDFKSLDARMELIAGTSGLAVITLCCAPDWMKGGASEQTDWSTLEKPPLPEHFGDFAALAEAVARRYTWVKHYQVWHPLNGFYDPARNDWDEQG